jgi:xanthine dehydrogenase molybdenum-binding subunit
VYGGAFRGLGNPQITYAMETQLDEIAEALSLDPVQIRLRNANKPRTKTVSGCLIGSCGLEECIRVSVEKSRWKQKKANKADPALWRRRGIGIACTVHGGSGVKLLWGKNCNSSSAVIKINTDGSVDLLIGSAELGQGSNTTLAMIAAEELGVSLESINVINGETDTTPPCGGTWGSRVTFTAGNAVRYAAVEAKKQVLEIAAELLEAPLDDLVVRDGRSFVADSPGKYITLAEAVAESWQNRGTPVIGKAVNDDPWCIQPDPESGYGNVSSAYAFGAQVAEVEVDLETGCVDVIGFWCAHDVGKVINALGAESQIEGGVCSMGIGYALLENLIITQGRVANSDFTSYRIPTMLDICEVNAYFIETIDEHGPFGAKGVGEPAMIPTAAAISNAVYDAVGVWVDDLPITPEKLLEKMKERKTPPDPKH